MKGTGIFCLHEIECKWFQGHFIPSSHNMNKVSTFGILAVEYEDVDECLICSDGGYREIYMTILSSKVKADRGENDDSRGNNKERRKLEVHQLECTGGDMLRISSKESSQKKELGIQVLFEADRIFTGKKAALLVQKYFSSLVSNESMSNDSVLDLLPDCAVVTGDMELKVPASFVHGDKNVNMQAGLSDFDDWLD